MSIADELARLEELRRIGSLTEIEFEEAKRLALNGQNTGQTAGNHAASQATDPNPYVAVDPARGNVNGFDEVHGVKENTWCALMHLSQLLTISGLGIIVPIVMFVTSKDETEMARRHGACMMNWFISSVIYAIVFVILSFFLIGIPLLILLGIVELVFPVIAAIKANEGKTWSYPGALRFFDEH